MMVQLLITQKAVWWQRQEDPQSRSGKRSSRLFSHFSDSAIAIISVSAKNPSRMLSVVLVVGVLSVSPRLKPMSVLRESPTGG